MKYLYFYLVCMMSVPVWAEDQHVKWGRTDFPPFTIIRGDLAGQGVTDQMIDFYIRHLPQYDHQKITASLQRVLNNMQKGEQICHGSLLWKKDRAEFVDYLEPNIAQFANGLITTKENAKRFAPYMVDDHTVDFDKLVTESTLKVRYHAKRSYSQVIDQVIETHQDRSAVLMRKTGLKETDKEIKLLLGGRLDAVIGRPEEGLYVMTQLDKADQMLFLNIAGDKPYKLAQIGCAKGDWNAQFITDVNALTLKYRTSDEFAGFYARWLPEDLRKIYLKMVKTVFAE
ncbi:TIGR02285 family protein [Terasakiella sp. A23]|uniref:TIGR02285 family protein n=1 Tax=Terasakiella sp. FCG-A23 TaxID=3080561 RepID=UPI002952E30C|nr:TIGR02285 family protein [Terasakiella sp. A23]MDV7340531.1 TIGR02285 family protein [Terasakiella sp. A23]